MNKKLLFLVMVLNNILAMEQDFDASVKQKQTDSPSEEKKISSYMDIKNVLDEISTIEQLVNKKKYRKAANLLFIAIYQKGLLKQDLEDEKRKKVENILTRLKKSRKKKVKTTITMIEAYEQIEQTKKNLILTDFFHTQFKNLPDLERIDQKKEEKSIYQKRTNEFNSLVTVMNREQFFIDHIFHGMKTSVEGDNSVLEKGIRDRLKETVPLLASELTSLENKFNELMSSTKQ